MSGTTESSSSTDHCDPHARGLIQDEGQALPTPLGWEDWLQGPTEATPPGHRRRGARLHCDPTEADLEPEGHRAAGLTLSCWLPAIKKTGTHSLAGVA